MCIFLNERQKLGICACYTSKKFIKVYIGRASRKLSRHRKKKVGTRVETDDNIKTFELNIISSYSVESAQDFDVFKY